MMDQSMTKKVLVIPDVHGRLFWKEPVAKYMDEVDRVVFLGDYLDPYSGETGLADDIYENLTLYWLKKVNDRVWKLPDHQVSIADPDIIERINQLDDDGVGQEMLGTVGRRRSWFGEKTGSVLWADIQEHDIDEAPNAYGLNKVFQVFGHTRLNEGYDKIEFDHLAMIDSRQGFVVEGKEPHAIVPSPR